MFGNRNLGYFEISDAEFEHMDAIKEIMVQVVVLKADFHFDDMCMHYCAIGPFADVEPSTVAPHYNIVCSDDWPGKPLTFQRGEKLDKRNWLHLKLYDCQTCYDTHEVSCHKCRGSGESKSGGQCTICNGGDPLVCPDCGPGDV